MSTGSAGPPGSASRRPSSVRRFGSQRRSTIRSLNYRYAGGDPITMSRRSSALLEALPQGPTMNHNTALILMYGIYACYVIACFGAVSIAAGLMLRMTGKNSYAADKGKLMAAVGMTICFVCFLIVFYCRSVKLDDQIMETIKEVALADDILIHSKHSQATWWQMRHGTVDNVSIHSGFASRPGSAASSHISLPIVRGYSGRPAEYMYPRANSVSSIHSSPGASCSHIIHGATSDLIAEVEEELLVTRNEVETSEQSNNNSKDNIDDLNKPSTSGTSSRDKESPSYTIEMQPEISSAEPKPSCSGVLATKVPSPPDSLDLPNIHPCTTHTNEESSSAVKPTSLPLVQQNTS